LRCCCCSTLRTYEALFESNGFNIAVVENDDIDFSSGSEDIGRVHASVSVPAHDLTISPRRRRVEPGGRIKFCIEPRVRQGADPFAAAAMIGVARVTRARVELVFESHTEILSYSVTISDGCVDLIVLVPQDAAPGSQVLLRRVSVAGYDVTLGEVPL
jgi:hypothetical protein